MILSSFDSLRKRVNDTKDHPIHALNWVLQGRNETLEKIKEIAEPLKNGGESEFRKFLSDSLKLPTQKKEYYINAKGEVYIKTA